MPANLWTHTAQPGT